jgi:hypothetical protein
MVIERKGNKMCKPKRIVKWGLYIGLTGCEREDTYELSDIMDEAEFDALSEEEQEEVLQNFAHSEMWDYVECWAVVENVKDNKGK